MITSEVILETPRLLLEPLLHSHAEALYELSLDPSIYEFIGDNPPASLEDLAARYQKWESRFSPDHKEVWLNWAVRLRETQEYAGTLQATIRKSGQAEIGYVFFPAYWRQGYAREACVRIIEQLRAEYEVETFMASIDTRNAASVHLIEALGFKRTYTRLYANFFRGTASHEYHYELLASNLPPLQS